MNFVIIMMVIILSPSTFPL